MIVPGGGVLLVEESGFVGLFMTVVSSDSEVLVIWDSRHRHTQSKTTDMLILLRMIKPSGSSIMPVLSLLPCACCCCCCWLGLLNMAMLGLPTIGDCDMLCKLRPRELSFHSWANTSASRSVRSFAMTLDFRIASTVLRTKLRPWSKGRRCAKSEFSSLTSANPAARAICIM